LNCSTCQLGGATCFGKWHKNFLYLASAGNRDAREVNERRNCYIEKLEFPVHGSEENTSLMDLRAETKCNKSSSYFIESVIKK